MPISNLPAQIQSMIQQNFLSRTLEDALRAKLGFRLIAERESFGAEIGESITKTRLGLLPAITTPAAPAANSDITSGMTPQQHGVEQYLLRVDQYPGTMSLNLVTSRVAIGNQFLINAGRLAEQAARSVDTLACNALFGAYQGGNSRVTTTLGAPATTVHVDDIRGWVKVVSGTGAPVAVSAANPVNTTVGMDVYSCVGAVADGVAPYNAPAFMVFSGASVNTSTAPGGFSGTLTFSSNVSVADATQGMPVVASNASFVVRPDGSSTSALLGTVGKSAKLTIDAVLAAKAALENNNVETLDNGLFNFFATPSQLTGLYQDPAFQAFHRGRTDSEDYKRGVVSELMGVEVVRTNLNPVQPSLGAGLVQRGIICGKGALVEGDYTGTGYAAAMAMGDEEMIQVIDGIAHITAEPIDALKQVVRQSWSYIGGFVAPTDALTTAATIPTATGSAHKRAAIVESL